MSTLQSQIPRPRMQAGISTRRQTVYLEHNSDNTTSTFKLRIDMYKHGTGRTDGKQYTVVEATILDAICDKPTLQAGAGISHIMKENRYPQYFYADNRNFLEAVLGSEILPSSADLSDEDWADMYGEAQPLAGKIVFVEVSKDPRDTNPRPKVVFCSEEQGQNIEFKS